MSQVGAGGRARGAHRAGDVRWRLLRHLHERRHAGAVPGGARPRRLQALQDAHQLRRRRRCRERRLGRRDRRASPGLRPLQQPGVLHLRRAVAPARRHPQAPAQGRVQPPRPRPRSSTARASTSPRAPPPPGRCGIDHTFPGAAAKEAPARSRSSICSSPARTARAGVGHRRRRRPRHRRQGPPHALLAQAPPGPAKLQLDPQPRRPDGKPVERARGPELEVGLQAFAKLARITSCPLPPSPRCRSRCRPPRLAAPARPPTTRPARGSGGSGLSGSLREGHSSSTAASSTTNRSAARSAPSTAWPTARAAPPALRRAQIPSGSRPAATLPSFIAAALDSLTPAAVLREHRR